MGGLLILALFLGYVQLVWFVCKKTPTIWAKALVLLIAVLAVSADAIYGRMKLKQMCEQEGGLKIYETVENVRGFEDRIYDTLYERDSPWITLYGYQFNEGRDGDKFFMKSKNNNGEVVSKIIKKTESIYVLDSVQIDENYFYIYRQTIHNKKQNKLLAELTYISYEGGWLERFFASIYASNSFAAECDTMKFPSFFVPKVLKPISKEIN